MFGVKRSQNLQSFALLASKKISGHDLLRDVIAILVNEGIMIPGFLRMNGPCIRGIHIENFGPHIPLTLRQLPIIIYLPNSVLDLLYYQKS